MVEKYLWLIRRIINNKMIMIYNKLLIYHQKEEIKNHQWEIQIIVLFIITIVIDHKILNRRQ